MNRVHYRNVLTGLSLGLFLSACAVQPLNAAGVTDLWAAAPARNKQQTGSLGTVSIDPAHS